MVVLAFLLKLYFQLALELDEEEVAGRLCGFEGCSRIAEYARQTIFIECECQRELHGSVFDVSCLQLVQRHDAADIGDA